MEINNKNFKKKLHGILEHIADATFVSFDLEMSGINRKTYGSQDHSEGKPSLQMLFEQTKYAAEKYQVLQFGMTLIEENREGGFYIARPYNFNISPLLIQDRAVKDRFPERNITFDSNATSFLVREGFDIGKIFISGVPYLSYVEEGEGLHRFRVRTGDERTKKLQPPANLEAIDFVNLARATILAWVDNPRPSYSFVKIGGPQGGMSSYHRKLVYDLIHEEFPGYRCAARDGGSFMQVTKISDTAQIQLAQEAYTKQVDAVTSQIGLRWIFDALSGGSLEALPPSWLMSDDDSTNERNQDDMKKDFELLRKRLREKKTVIVGHNLFTDLVFLIKTFTGSLPNKWEDFQQTIRDRFPIIIDTKYMATAEIGRMSPEMQKDLTELFQPFRTCHVPIVIQDSLHLGYVGPQGKKHEAGYDSWVTAQLFLKMAGRLYAESKLPLHDSSDISAFRPANQAYRSPPVGGFGWPSSYQGIGKTQTIGRYTGSPKRRGQLGNGPTSNDSVLHSLAGLDFIDNRPPHSQKESTEDTAKRNSASFAEFAAGIFDEPPELDDNPGFFSKSLDSSYALGHPLDPFFNKVGFGKTIAEKNALKNPLDKNTFSELSFEKKSLEKSSLTSTGIGPIGNIGIGLVGLDSDHIRKTSIGKIFDQICLGDNNAVNDTGNGRISNTGTGSAGTGKAGTGKAGTGKAGTGKAGTGNTSSEDYFSDVFDDPITWAPLRPSKHISPQTQPKNQLQLAGGTGSSLTIAASTTPYTPLIAFSPNPGTDAPVITEQWLPPMTDHFWMPYVNMLRINACDVGFCNLAALGAVHPRSSTAPKKIRH